MIQKLKYQISIYSWYIGRKFVNKITKNNKNYKIFDKFILINVKIPIGI